MHISAFENLQVPMAWERDFWRVFIYFENFYSVGKDKDVKSAAMFIQQQFIDQNIVSSKVIYPPLYHGNRHQQYPSGVPGRHGLYTQRQSQKGLHLIALYKLEKVLHSLCLCDKCLPAADSKPCFTYWHKLYWNNHSMHFNSVLWNFYCTYPQWSHLCHFLHKNKPCLFFSCDLHELIAFRT